MKKIDYNKENFRLIAFIISNATSGSLFTKLLKDAGWTPESTASQEWQLAKKSKEDYLFDEFVKIAEQGRNDILDFVVDKIIKKDAIYFKVSDKAYKFPKDSLISLKKKVGKEIILPKKKNLKIFNERKLHNSVVYVSKKLFSDSYYSQSIFEACKLLNKRVQELSGLTIDGKKLMLDAFSVHDPKLKLADLSDQSGKDEQEGFMHIFAGVLLRTSMTRNIKNFKTRYKSLKLKCLNIVKQITNTKILLLQLFP